MTKRAAELGLVAAAEAYLREELKSGALRSQFFPMLTAFGIRDYTDTVRTFGLNYLTEIGRRILGITAVSDYPVLPQGKYNARDFREVRLGSVWFEKQNNQPFLIAEFERYDDQPGKSSSFRQRIEDLLLGYHQLGDKPKLVLLVFWTYLGVDITRVEKITKILDQGFSFPNTALVTGLNEEHTRILIYYCPVAGSQDNLVMNHWIAVR